MTRGCQQLVALSIVVVITGCESDDMKSFQPPGPLTTISGEAEPSPEDPTAPEEGLDADGTSIQAPDDEPPDTPDTPPRPGSQLVGPEWSGQDACETNLDYFHTEVWSAFMQTTCLTCHHAEGAAAGTGLVLEPGDDEASLRINYEILEALAAEKSAEGSRLWLKPTGQHSEGHGGQQQIDPDSAESTALLTLIDRMFGIPTGCGQCNDSTVGRRRLRLLTPDEYDRTIEALFGFASNHGAQFAQLEEVHGFNNHADVRRVNRVLLDQIATAAGEVAAKAVEKLGEVAPCDLLDQSAQDCAYAMLGALGTRIYRRPLSEEEKQEYLPLFDYVRESDSYSAAIEVLIQALLQSPHFLYRSELGTKGSDGLYTLSEFELASELSYLIWGSMPDDELLSLAQAGTLSDPTVLSAQATRLLASPRSKASIKRFFVRWLGLQSLETMSKDQETFPHFNEDVRSSLLAEYERLVVAMFLEEGASLTSLLTSPKAWLNEALADYYGVSGVTGTELQEVVLPAQQRAGLLTTGAVMSRYGGASQTLPVHRGILIRERVLCQELSPPPTDLVIEPPPLDPTKTSRERFHAHSSQEPCASCHRLIDPLGFAFEHYDGAGAYRSDDAGRPVDASGMIEGSRNTDGAFANHQDFTALLASSDEVANCFSRQWFHYAYGIESDEANGCINREIETDFLAGGVRLEPLIQSLISQPHFFRRHAGTQAAADTELTLPEAIAFPEAPSAELEITRDDKPHHNGYCTDVTVTNLSDSTLDWAVELSFEGTIVNIWNATYDVLGDRMYRFQGVEWNAQVSPGDNASFGLCATL